MLDDEDNLFAPPKLTDEDFSPFGSRGGLFSGGKGLFDDEDEEVSRWESRKLSKAVSWVHKEEMFCSFSNKRVASWLEVAFTFRF